MIIRKNDQYTMWGPGVRPESINSENKYLITSATESFGFDSFQEAEAKYSTLS